MKKLLFALSLMVLIGGATPVLAQENHKLTPKEQRKLEKQKKKEAKLKAEQDELNRINALVKDTSFVFKADRLYNKAGVSFEINSSLNFLAVQQGQAVYQFAFNGV